MEKIIPIKGKFNIQITQGSSSVNTLSSNSYTAPSDEFFINSAIIPYSFYNVVTGSNDSIVTSAGTATISGGQYTLAQLISSMQTQLQTLDATFTLSQATNSKLVTIARSTNFTVTSNLLSTQLGFSGSLSGAATYTGSNIPIISIKYITLHNSILSRMNPKNFYQGGNIDFVAQMPLAGNLGDIIYYYPPIKNIMKLTKDFNLDFSLWTIRDDQGRIINFLGESIYLELIFV